MEFLYNGVTIELDDEVKTVLENFRKENHSILDTILFLNEHFQVKNCKQIIHQIFNKIFSNFNEDDVIFISQYNFIENMREFFVYKMNISDFLNLKIESPSHVHVMTSKYKDKFKNIGFQVFDTNEIDSFLICNDLYQDCWGEDHRNVNDSFFNRNYSLGIYYTFVHEYFNKEYHFNKSCMENIA